MVSISSGYPEPLASLGASLSRLDVITSLAMAAVSAPTQFTRPRVRVTQEGHSAQVSLTKILLKDISYNDSSGLDQRMPSPNC